MQTVSNDRLPAGSAMSRYQMNDVLGWQVAASCYTQLVCTHTTYNTHNHTAVLLVPS